MTEKRDPGSKDPDIMHVWEGGLANAEITDKMHKNGKEYKYFLKLIRLY